MTWWDSFWMWFVIWFVLAQIFRGLIAALLWALDIVFPIEEVVAPIYLGSLMTLAKQPERPLVLADEEKPK